MTFVDAFVIGFYTTEIFRIIEQRPKKHKKSLINSYQNLKKIAFRFLHNTDAKIQTSFIQFLQTLTYYSRDIIRMLENKAFF